MARIEAEIAHAESEGGRLFTGGRRPSELSRGWFFEQTIVECPAQSLRIVDTELFAPGAQRRALQDGGRGRWACQRDALWPAARVITRNGAKALRVTKALCAGIVSVNTCRVVSPIAEFGGYQESGYGRHSGLQAIF